ncbi:enoyl-CoA hydratase [Rhizobiales bacterium GAS191]|jgi:enoyl-CoA hydratase|nr:enoyl-CoA hydratase [Rhizobiales bacterium GAS113]SEB89705.1 enoyl-CoA hydratase [Rhizobiales bacterium GAS191]SED27971.1 enoyl-CoA hydratase [Rhizobiales bacterium GAS188]
MADTDTIGIERRGRVAILSFNRPRVLNAFDGPLVEATMRAMAELSADEDVLAIVVRGEGRAFSAGFDLKAGAATAGERKPAEWRRMLEADFDFIMAFWDCPKPTIAAIHGYCIGGAFELSLACDVTVAASGTRLGAPEVKFGSGAVAMLLPFVTGAKAAKEILLTGDDHLSAERALALGIVNHVVPAGEELAKALAIAESIAAADPMAVQLSKRAVNRSYEAMGLRAALAQALETDIFIECAGGPRRTEFDRIRREEGLQAALAWRDRREP